MIDMLNYSTPCAVCQEQCANFIFMLFLSNTIDNYAYGKKNTDYEKAIDKYT